MDRQPSPFSTAVPVEIQDQTSEPIDLYFCRTLLTKFAIVAQGHTVVD